MKTALFTLFLCGTASAAPRSIEGHWLGLLDAGEVKLRVGLHIEQKPDGNYTATLSSLDQGMADVPMEHVTWVEPKFHAELAKLNVRIDGTLASNALLCTFSQNGHDMSLPMNRVAAFAMHNRPQEPKRPFPYREEEVSVTVPSIYGSARARVLQNLAGTLTLPQGKGPFPAVLFITGSGSQDRDETIFDHKPFLVLSDALTHAGIATLRFDDRGVGKSAGSGRDLTTLDLAEDTRAELQLLVSRPEIDKRRVGLIGHSEGGVIAPLVASTSALPRFLVLLAGTGMDGFHVLEGQTLALMRAAGQSEDKNAAVTKLNDTIRRIIASESDAQKREAKIRAALKDRPELVESAVDSATSWMHTFLTLDPVPVLERVKVPVLALNGERDLQVLPENLRLIEAALHKGGNTAVTTQLLPGLNHLFQHAKTGAPSEYGTIEETMSPDVIAKVRDWVLAR